MGPFNILISRHLLIYCSWSLGVLVSHLQGGLILLGGIQSRRTEDRLAVSAVADEESFVLITAGYARSWQTRRARERRTGRLDQEVGVGLFATSDTLTPPPSF